MPTGRPSEDDQLTGINTCLRISLSRALALAAKAHPRCTFARSLNLRRLSLFSPLAAAFDFALDFEVADWCDGHAGGWRQKAPARVAVIADAAACEAIKTSVVLHHIVPLPEWERESDPQVRMRLANRPGGQFCKRSGSDALLLLGTPRWDVCVLGILSPSLPLWQFEHRFVHLSDSVNPLMKPPYIVHPHGEKLKQQPAHTIRRV